MGTEKAIDRIKAVHIPLWLQRFEEKAADYNDTGDLPFEPHTVLGIRGQFADLWRKVWKLKRALWDGQKLNGKQPIENIDELIAHLFLTRDLLAEELPPPGKWRKVGATSEEKPQTPDVEKVEVVRGWVNHPEIQAAGRLAASGDCAALERRGLMLVEMPGGCGLGCGPSGGVQQHYFRDACRYRIKMRRES